MFNLTEPNNAFSVVEATDEGATLATLELLDVTFLEVLKVLMKGDWSSTEGSLGRSLLIVL